MQALLIIDMQVEGFPPESPRFDVNGVVENINRLAEAVRKRGGMVVFIQHDGTLEGEYIPGTAGWELLPSLRRGPEDVVVGKSANDPFYDTALESMLRDAEVDELIVTGWATDYCVDTAVRSALGRDFHVVVAGDAHTCDDRPHLTSRQIIDHHNRIWATMIPTRGSVRVGSTASLLGNAG